MTLVRAIWATSIAQDIKHVEWTSSWNDKPRQGSGNGDHTGSRTSPVPGLDLLLNASVRADPLEHALALVARRVDQHGAVRREVRRLVEAAVREHLGEARARVDERDLVVALSVRWTTATCLPSGATRGREL